MSCGHKHDLESLKEKLVLKLSESVCVLCIHHVVLSLRTELIKHHELFICQCIDHHVQLYQSSDLGLDQRLLVLLAQQDPAQRIRVSQDFLVLRLGNLLEEFLNVRADGGKVDSKHVGKLSHFEPRCLDEPLDELQLCGKRVQTFLTIEYAALSRLLNLVGLLGRAADGTLPATDLKVDLLDAPIG